jgi:hypothetical protein
MNKFLLTLSMLILICALTIMYNTKIEIKNHENKINKFVISERIKSDNFRNEINEVITSHLNDSMDFINKIVDIQIEICNQLDEILKNREENHEENK